MTSQVSDKSHIYKCSDSEKCSECSSGPDALIFDRKKLLEITSALIQETYGRVSGDRFRLREGDKERLQYLRALTGLVALHTALLEKAGAPDLDGIKHPVYNCGPVTKSDIDKLLEGL